jgi:hydroxymethylglutaryl-CoA synthase
MKIDVILVTSIIVRNVQFALYRSKMTKSNKRRRIEFMRKYGIISYGVSVPYRRLPVKATLDVWLTTSPELIISSLGVSERGVLGFDQDGNTFAVDAIKAAIEKNGSAQDADVVLYGTATNPYDSRPSATIIAEATNIKHSAFSADLQFSGKSGTAALILASGMVGADLSKTAIAVAADTINRHTAPGDMTEPYAGAGAGALALGTEDVIATIDGYESFATDLSDNFRVEGERYIKSGMLLGQAKNDIGIYDHTVTAGEALMKKLGTTPADYTYCVAQQTTPSEAKKIAAKLGFTQEQTEKCLFAGTIGDTGAASTFIGLAKVLDSAKPGEKIFIISYGYGAGADAISLTVTENIGKVQGKGASVEALVNNKQIIDYGTATKYEYKFIRHSFPSNAYL